MMFYIKWALSTWFGILHLGRYDAEWDGILNKLLDDESLPKSLGDYCVTIGKYEIWIANAYYSYGGLHWVNCAGYEPLGDKLRPSVSTMHKLDKMVNKLSEVRSKKLREQEKSKMKEIFGDKYTA